MGLRVTAHSLRTGTFTCLLSGLLLCAGCGKDKESAPSAASPLSATKAFTDVTEAAGIKHCHHKPVLDHKLDNIMSWVCSVGAAAAAADFDNDGWIDLYVTNSDKGTPNFLYRNNGDGTFTDVAKKAGLADLNGDDGVSMDCRWATTTTTGGKTSTWSVGAVIRSSTTTTIPARRDSRPLHRDAAEVGVQNS
jgi:hypothetical protein